MNGAKPRGEFAVGDTDHAACEIAERRPALFNHTKACPAKAGVDTEDAHEGDPLVR